MYWWFLAPLVAGLIVIPSGSWLPPGQRRKGLRPDYLTTSPQDVPGAPGAVSAELFHCRAGRGDLFDSRDRACEGQTLDRSLGSVITGA